MSEDQVNYEKQNELIAIHQHKGQKLIDARELHSFIQNKRGYTSWIKKHIQKYGFVEGEDYTFFQKNVNSKSRKRNEYAITLDMGQ